MTTLHLVCSSPLISTALDRALSFASKDDAILLIENGVYAASQCADNAQRLAAAATAGLSCFVLQEDLSARALLSPLKEFKAVSYAEFVELVCQYKNSVNWG